MTFFSYLFPFNYCLAANKKLYFLWWTSGSFFFELRNLSNRASNILLQTETSVHFIWSPLFYLCVCWQSVVGQCPALRSCTVSFICSVTVDNVSISHTVSLQIHFPPLLLLRPLHPAGAANIKNFPPHSDLMEFEHHLIPQPNISRQHFSSSDLEANRRLRKRASRETVWIRKRLTTAAAASSRRRDWY